MSSRAPAPHPARPESLPQADVPFVRRWPQQGTTMPHWRDPQLPTLAQMLRRYGREGSVLSSLPHQPELQQIDPAPPAPAHAQLAWDDRDTIPQPLAEPFTEPLEGLQTREINDDAVFSTLFGELR